MADLSPLEEQSDLKQITSNIERSELNIKEIKDGIQMIQARTSETIEELYSELAELVPGESFPAMRNGLRLKYEELLDLKEQTRKDREDKMLKKGLMNQKVAEIKAEMNKLQEENRMLEEKLKPPPQSNKSSIEPV